jgi:carbon monoxide dehydrogenase subunit G
MIVEAQVTINGSKAEIWAAITDIENAWEIISGIPNIEVLEKPLRTNNGMLRERTRFMGR